MDALASSPACRDHWSSGHILRFLLIATLLIAVAAPTASARSRSRSSAAAAQARRQRAIKAIQQQVAAAQQILNAAESQAAMSQAEVSKAVEKLSGIREQIHSEQQSVQESNKSLQGLEADILGEQGPDSEFAKAQKALKAARHDLHRVMHQVLALPDDGDKPDEAARLSDLAGLSPEDKKKLEGDFDYEGAQDNVKLAARHLDEVRRTILEANTDWVAARKELASDEKSVRESSQHSQSAGLDSLDDRQNLHRAQTIAANARAVIAQGEARLRQLGVKPKVGYTSASASQGKR